MNLIMSMECVLRLRKNECGYEFKWSESGTFEKGNLCKFRRWKSVNQPISVEREFKPQFGILCTCVCICIRSMSIVVAQISIFIYVDGIYGCICSLFRLPILLLRRHHSVKKIVLFPLCYVIVSYGNKIFFWSVCTYICRHYTFHVHCSC